MTPSELRALLEAHGIRPVKDRGQHFLLDENVVRAMADAAGIGGGELVVEVGPGPGILTAELLRRQACVVAIEIDARLRALLADRFRSSAFHLVAGDVLAMPNAKILGDFARHQGRDARLRELAGEALPPYKVVANLPYGITSDVLTKFLTEEPVPASVTVMVQREVADRILAGPGEMSAFTVFVRTLADVRRVVNVPRGSFLPPPKVDSAVIHIVPKDGAALAAFFGAVDKDRYFTLVRTAFRERRKQLKNTLRAIERDASKLEKAFKKAKIAPSARPEELDIGEWRELAAALTA